jgi:DNA-binding transcriptional ArsR family regulator
VARAKLEKFDPRLVGLAAFARALSHPARIAILRQLIPGRETPAMTIVKSLPLSQPACSRHLAELVKAGLLKSRDSGSHVYYRIEQSNLDQFCREMAAILHDSSSKKIL